MGFNKVDAGEMGKYTRLGSTDLDNRIDADLRRIAEVAETHSLAGILLGGYGRGEGTPFINADGSQSPFNDYDLIVVVDKLEGPVRQKFQLMERQLTKELGLPVDLYPYRKAALPRCEFSLLNYEIKHGHQVIWGAENILDTMPEYPHHAIPLSEGARLLLNRGKLLLDIKQRLAHSKPLSPDEHSRFIKYLSKVLLAFGDCALLAEKNYDISYAVKKVNISTIGKIPDRDFIVEGYLRAIELKEWGNYNALENFDIKAEFKIVRDVFQRFMPWYRAQYPGKEGLILKSIALNLFWHGQPLPSHPRVRLYEALPELLGSYPDEHFLRKILCCNDDFVDAFYRQQRRFS
jgi:hypothetical protein